MKSVFAKFYPVRVSGKLKLKLTVTDIYPTCEEILVLVNYVLHEPATCN
jgi:hypothetical protein